MQEDACFARTTCALRQRLFPFRCHARFATCSPTHLGDGLTKYARTGSFVALYRILLNAFSLPFLSNVPFRLNMCGLTEQSESLSPSQVNGPATCDSEPDPPRDNPLVDSEKGTARLSSAAKAHQTWLRKRSARWHSIVAGAVAGGVAISFESLSRRKVIAQQLFVRRVTHCPIAYLKLNAACYDVAGFKVHIMRTRRSAGFTSRTGMSSYLFSREFPS